jgi:hypothetical protein
MILDSFHSMLSFGANMWLRNMGSTKARLHIHAPGASAFERQSTKESPRRPVGHSPSSTDDLADDTNTFRGLRNPVAVEPVSKSQAPWKLRVFDWLKSWTLMMLDWPKSWAPMVIDWTKSWTPRRSRWIPCHLLPPPPLLAFELLHAPAASRAGALVVGLEFKLVLGAAVTEARGRFAGFPGF